MPPPFNRKTEKIKNCLKISFSYFIVLPGKNPQTGSVFEGTILAA